MIKKGINSLDLYFSIQRALAILRCGLIIGLTLLPAYVEATPIYKITKGKGLDVCEAYLQRLNVTYDFDKNPTHEDYSELSLVPLTAEEMRRLYYKINSFDRYQDQNIIDNYRDQHKDASTISYTNNASQEQKKIDEFIKDEKNQFSRYQFPLDLDNDGFANNFVIKINAGIYIVDEQLQRIDEERMKAIFADREMLDWPIIAQFPPLAYPIHLFRYKEKYYFDGFLDFIVRDAIQISKMVDPYTPKKVGVFIHEQYKTHEVCEYILLNGVVETRHKYKYEK